MGIPAMRERELPHPNLAGSSGPEGQPERAGKPFSPELDLTPDDLNSIEGTLDAHRENRSGAGYSMAVLSGELSVLGRRPEPFSRAEWSEIQRSIEATRVLSETESEAERAQNTAEVAKWAVLAGEQFTLAPEDRERWHRIEGQFVGNPSPQNVQEWLELAANRRIAGEVVEVPPEMLERARKLFEEEQAKESERAIEQPYLGSVSPLMRSGAALRILGERPSVSPKVWDHVRAEINDLRNKPLEGVGALSADATILAAGGVEVLPEGGLVLNGRRIGRGET